LVFGEDRLQELEPLLAGRAAKAREGPARGGHGAVDIGGAADGDLGVGFLGRRIDDVEELRLDRIDPVTVDVELLLVSHDCLSASIRLVTIQLAIFPTEYSVWLYSAEHNERKEGP